MFTARSARGLPAGALAAALGVLCGLLAVANVERLGPLARPGFALITTLPMAAYVAGAIALVAAVFINRHWWVGVSLFFLWLPFEDLVRKYAGNDLRVYALKDLFFVIAVAGIAPRLVGSGIWRRVLGPARQSTIAVLAVAAVLCIPSALANPRVPLLGMKLRFGYMPLVAIGAYVAMDAVRLRRALTLLAALSAVVCALGLLQVVFGADFLAPARDTPNLRLLVVRDSAAGEVVRPNGPFVDPGRFASMTVISLTLGLALVRVAVRRAERTLGIATAGIAIAAAFASGGRAQLVFAVLVALVGMFFSSTGKFRHGRGAVVLAMATVAALFFFALQALAPRATESRLRYYGDSLSPTSQTAELAPRSGYYWHEAVGGIRAGGLLGRGTGTAAIGRQYYAAASDAGGEGESGWGAIAREWGIVGLAVWVWWVAVWCRRGFRAATDAASTHLRGAGAPLATFIAVNLTIAFTLGIQTFENYLTNAFLWLFSGMLFAAFILAEREPASDQVAGSPYGLPAAS